MNGKIWEWCLDQWDENAYAKRQNKVSDPVQWTAEHTRRVMRGGITHAKAECCHTSFRYHKAAGVRYHPELYENWSFRLVRSEL